MPRLHKKNLAQKIRKIYKSMRFLILKKDLTRKDINKMAIYSPRKIKRKLIELYSVLKPLTNSDSPSEKSKGVRLVSAKVDNTNKTTRANMNENRGDIFLTQRI